MNHRAALISFLAEMAVRSKDIMHVPGNERNKRRFFQWGSSEAALLANYALNNTGWNLLVDMLPAGNMDNKHDSSARLFKVALLFIRVSSGDDLVAINDTLNEAWGLGWEFLLKMREHAVNPCGSAISAKGNIPTAVYLESVKHMEVAPLLFIGDKHYGYRFEVDVRYQRDIALESESEKWNDEEL